MGIKDTIEDVNNFLGEHKGDILAVIGFVKVFVPLVQKILESFNLSLEDIDVESGELLPTAWEKLEAQGVSREDVMNAIQEARDKASKESE